MRYFLISDIHSNLEALQATVEFAKKYNVPVRVLSSFHDVPGTLVTKEDKAMEKVVVAGVAYDKNQAKVTLSGVADKPGVAAKLFGRIAEAGLNVDMIIQNISRDGKADISFTIPKTDLKKALPLLKKIAKSLGNADVAVMVVSR